MKIVVETKGQKILVLSETLSDDNFLMTLKSRVFNSWFGKISPKLGVQEVNITNVDFKGRPSKDNVLFVRIHVKTKYLPYVKSIEIVGGIVAILPIINVGSEKYAILVEQDRITAGSDKLLEVPAGIIDNISPHDEAIREVSEELGISLKNDELKALCDYPLHSDMTILSCTTMFYYFEQEWSINKLNSFSGRKTGLSEEGENITLRIIPLDSLQKVTTDQKTIVAKALYDK